MQCWWKKEGWVHASTGKKEELEKTKGVDGSMRMGTVKQV